MSLYRVYIDEVGNHDLVHADNPNQCSESPLKTNAPFGAFR